MKTEIRPPSPGRFTQLYPNASFELLDNLLAAQYAAAHANERRDGSATYIESDYVTNTPIRRAYTLARKSLRAQQYREVPDALLDLLEIDLLTGYKGQQGDNADDRTGTCEDTERKALDRLHELLRSKRANSYDERLAETDWWEVLRTVRGVLTFMPNTREYAFWYMGMAYSRLGFPLCGRIIQERGVQELSRQRDYARSAAVAAQERAEREAKEKAEREARAEKRRTQRENKARATGA